VWVGMSHLTSLCPIMCPPRTHLVQLEVTRWGREPAKQAGMSMLSDVGLHATIGCYRGGPRLLSRGSRARILPGSPLLCSACSVVLRCFECSDGGLLRVVIGLVGTVGPRERGLVFPTTEVLGP